MNSLKEINAFVEAYGRIFGYVPKDDVEHIVFMLVNDEDEEEVYERFPDATSVLDAFYMWNTAKNFTQGVFK